MLIALVAVAVALGVGEVIQPWFGIENVDLVFLTAIVAVAVRYGLWPSLFASVAASLCYNFFFLPPIYTFTIADPTNVAAFVLLHRRGDHRFECRGARAHAGRDRAWARARATESLYAFSRKLAGAGTLDDVLWATAYQTALMLKVRVVLLLPENGSIAVKAGYPPEDTLDEADLAAANWAWQNDRAAGRGSDTLPGAKRLFLPMRTGRGAIGVVGIDSDKPGPLLTPDQRRLLDALIDQGALAIERVRLVEDMDRVKRTVETDRLRSALLTSISHDLKTPLAAVLGAAGTLRDLSDKLDRRREGRPAGDDHRRIRAAQSVHCQSARHDQTGIRRHRAERRAARPRRNRRQCPAARQQDSRSASCRPEPCQQILPMLELDAVLFEQVLFNLLDNAAKYAPAGTTIRIQSWRDDDSVWLQILDEGEGIPPADLEHIFDKFYRAQKGDHVRAGTGLGLAISRGFVEAMHGTITAANRTDRTGAVFTITLPIPAEIAARWTPPHERRPAESPGHRRRAAHSQTPAHGPEHARLRNPRGAEWQDCARASEQKPDLIILDLGLPDIQGLDLLRMIRARNESVPVVVLSSRGDEAGKVQALDLGADDYVTKPFGMDELLARMRAAMRHQLQVHGERPIFRVGDLSVDLVRRIVKVGDDEVKLSPKEYELLRVLVQHAGKVLTHKFLLGELWDDLTDAQYLRVYVRQLRQKIEADPERPQYVLTETGIGYRLRAPD